MLDACVQPVRAFLCQRGTSQGQYYDQCDQGQDPFLHGLSPPFHIFSDAAKYISIRQGCQQLKQEVCGKDKIVPFNDVSAAAGNFEYNQSTFSTNHNLYR